MYVCYFSLIITSNVFAATKEDVIAAINKTYTVGTETFRLPQKIITKGENYLKKNPMTSSQYDTILSCIDSAVALAREAGTTDLTKISKEDMNRALNILLEASRTANIDLNKELAENNVSISNNANSATNTTSNNENNKINNTSDSTFNSNTVSTNNNPKTEDKQDSSLDNTSIVLSGDKGISGETEVISGDILDSGEKQQDNISASNEELLNNLLANFTQEESDENVDMIVNRNINIAIVGLILILFIIILLFYLILKSKWNKIIKCIIIIIFVVLIITVSVVLILTFSYMEQIKLIYKLYYMFK